MPKSKGKSVPKLGKDTELISLISQAVVNMRQEQVMRLIALALSNGNTAEEILHSGLWHGLECAGRLYQAGEYFVPELIVCSDVVKAGVTKVQAYLEMPMDKAAKKIIAGTVQGDLHDIGKDILVMLLRASGYIVEDLGVDVSPERFLSAVNGSGVTCVCISCLLGSCRSNVSETVARLRQGGPSILKIFVGGAAISETFATQIGADGYARDAFGLVSLLGVT